MNKQFYLEKVRQNFADLHRFSFEPQNLSINTPTVLLNHKIKEITMPVFFTPWLLTRLALMACPVTLPKHLLLQNLLKTLLLLNLLNQTC